MTRHSLPYAVRLAASQAEVEAAQALRFRVFVEELGAEAGAACADARREWDRFDDACEHLLLIDRPGSGEVVGVTRLMDEAGAERAGGFASEEEFDIAALRRSGRGLLEMGRSCLHPRHRGGAALHLLWQALARIVEERGVGLVFGLASLPGTDARRLAGPLALLAADHLAPKEARPVSHCPVRPPGPTLGPLDRRLAALALPPLVRAYLRMGGKVGDGAFADHRFGCTDVCMVLDTATLQPRAQALLGALPEPPPPGAPPGMPPVASLGPPRA